MRLSDRGELLDSFAPAFSGVLSVIAPTASLSVPEWAEGRLDSAMFAELVGMAAAASGWSIAEATQYGDALDLQELLPKWRVASGMSERYRLTVEHVERHKALIRVAVTVHDMLTREDQDPAADSHD